MYVHVHVREQLKKQEEMVARQEEMRRKTAEHEAELRTRTELAKAKAEAEGRIAQERANHDLILEKVKLEAAERRDTVLKAIADGGKLIGEGLATYIDDTEKLRNTALAVTGIAAGVYAAKTGIGIGGRFVEVSKGTKASGQTEWNPLPRNVLGVSSLLCLSFLFVWNVRLSHIVYPTKPLLSPICILTILGSTWQA